MFHSFYGWYLKCQSDTQTLAIFTVQGTNVPVLFRLLRIMTHGQLRSRQIHFDGQEEIFLLEKTDLVKKAFIWQYAHSS